MIQQKVEQDLKEALLARDTLRVSVLRSLKSAVGYAKVSGSSKKADLSEEEILAIFAKEAKKRQESADSFNSAGAHDRAEIELSEKQIIAEYLPEPFSEEEVKQMVDKAFDDLKDVGPQSMGQIIGKVKHNSQGRADGSLIAKLVKERLNTK